MSLKNCPVGCHYQRLAGLLPIVVAVALLTTLEHAGASVAKGPTPAAGQALTHGEASFRTVEWTDLMPKDDLDALLNPPQAVNDIEDGSFEDQISSQIQNALTAAGDDRYQQALVSTRVVAELDGKAIRIPGFIVPLEFNDQQAITQFFLVPYFGACIHVPPPPPNQIILVNYAQGMALDALYDPFWISGVVKTSVQKNDLATAAYVMEVELVEPYQSTDTE